MDFPSDWPDRCVAEAVLGPYSCYACAQQVEFDVCGLTLDWSWVGYVRWVCSRDCEKAVIAQSALEGLVHDPDTWAGWPEDDSVSVQRASDYRRPDYGT